jgi:hypothetical protein
MLIAVSWENNLKETDNLGNFDTGGRIILKWILKEADREWADLIWHRIGTKVGLL